MIDDDHHIKKKSLGFPHTKPFILKSDWDSYYYVIHIPCRHSPLMHRRGLVIQYIWPYQSRSSGSEGRLSNHLIPRSTHSSGSSSPLRLHFQSRHMKERYWLMSTASERVTTVDASTFGCLAWYLDAWVLGRLAILYIRWIYVDMWCITHYASIEMCKGIVIILPFSVRPNTVLVAPFVTLLTSTGCWLVTVAPEDVCTYIHIYIYIYTYTIDA